MFNFNGNSSNPGQNTQIGNIMVEYINLMPESNQSYSFPTDTLKEPVGNSFDMNHYVNEIPQGYHFVKILGGSSVKYFRNNPQVVVIGIAPNQQQATNFNAQPRQNNVPAMSTMYITYKNINGKYLNGTTVKAQTGTGFNVRPYTQMLPMGYKFAYTKNVPSRYTNGTHIEIVVKPLDYDQPQTHVQQPSQQANQANVQRNNQLNQQAQQRARQAAQQRKVQQQRYRAQQAKQQAQNSVPRQQPTDPTVNGGYQNANVNQGPRPNQNSVMERRETLLHDDEDDKELDAIGSILATIGKGLSQLGYALKHRHHRR